MQCKRPILKERQTDTRKEGWPDRNLNAREQQRQKKRNSETEMENNTACVCARKTEMEGRGAEIKQETMGFKKSCMRSRYETKSRQID